jgi:hypothetical protein
VQVFSRRHDEPIHALLGPASEKRHGTKSRWVVQRLLAASCVAGWFVRNGRRHCFASKNGCGFGVLLRKLRQDAHLPQVPDAVEYDEIDFVGFLALPRRQIIDLAPERDGL